MKPATRSRWQCMAATHLGAAGNCKFKTKLLGALSRRRRRGGSVDNGHDMHNDGSQSGDNHRDDDGDGNDDVGDGDDDDDDGSGNAAE